MSAALRASLRALDDENLAACPHGLREGIERGRLAGNRGMANFYDTLGALLDAERDRRAGEGNAEARRLLGLLGERTAALSHGELLALAIHTTTGAPPVASPPVVAFLGALAGVLNDECRRRVGV